jgi:hypothetical protein
MILKDLRLLTLSKTENVENMNNSNTKSYLTKNKKYGAGFPASLMDGPTVDLFEIAEIEYTDELSDAVWRSHNWQSLLEKCRSIEIITLQEHDDYPGQSDVTFWIAIDDPIKFKRQLRKAILDCLKHQI